MGIIETLQEEWLEKGLKKKEIEIAQTMKSYGYPAEEIAKITGLSLKEIEALVPNKEK